VLIKTAMAELSSRFRRGRKNPEEASRANAVPTWGSFAPIQVNLTEFLLSDIAV